jgi:hypothetical protein
MLIIFFFELISAKADKDHHTGILDKGPCPLHTTNNGFKAGLKEFEVVDILQYVDGDLVFCFELSLGCPKYCKISILVLQYPKSSILVYTSIEQYS